MENLMTHTPINTIVLWFGKENEIPDGWNICDGRNGRPNLINRVAIGTNRDRDLGTRGGNNQIQLTENQLPEHTHDLEEAGNHSHNYGTSSGNVETNDNVMENNFDNGNNWGLWMTNNRFQTTNSGSHTHRVHTAGENSPIDITPSYCKLYYIIKTR